MVAAPARCGEQGDEHRLEVFETGASAKRCGRAAVEHLAGIHRHQPVETRRLFHVGRRNQHAHAGPAGAYSVDQFPELAPRERIDSGGRLVEDQQVGVVDQRAAQTELLLHPARELHRGTIPEGSEAGGLQQGFDADAAFGAALAEQAGEEFDVLPHRQRRVEVLAQTLGHIGDSRLDAGAKARLADITAKDLDSATLDPAYPGDQRQHAGFADPVRTDEADHHPGGHLELER